MPSPLVLLRMFRTYVHFDATFQQPARISVEKMCKIGFASIRKHCHQTFYVISVYELFTPSHHDQRSPPLFYRGCWHRVAHDFAYSTPSIFRRGRLGLQSKLSSRVKERGQVRPSESIAQTSILPPRQLIEDRISFLL